MRTATPIPSHLLTGPRPARWRTLLVTTAAALTLTISAGGIVSAQDATPTAAGAECVPIEDGEGCLPIAPMSARVDLAEPVFSNPTAITNPLFPISDQAHLLQLGVDDGETLRAEATLMPETKMIKVGDQEIEAVVSQFIAYGDGRVREVAYDYFAQDDAGNVWYLGEDVFNYEDGVVKDTGGTWLAGKDGPAGMIMPANPKVGDVYRPENIPGFVFEETTVVATDVVVNGPRGPIEGAVEVLEHGQDDSFERKVFAPGYGEFSAHAGAEYLVAALDLPVDASTTRMPSELDILATSAAEIAATVPSEDWETISATSTLVTTVWEVTQIGETPPLLSLQMDRAVEELDSAVEDEDVVETRQAAIDVQRAILDLQLQYRPIADVDLAVMRLWGTQITVDVVTQDLGRVSGDVVALETVWARVGPSVDATTAGQVDTLLADLRTAADAGDLAAANDLATQLDTLLAGDETVE